MPVPGRCLAGGGRLQSLLPTPFRSVPSARAPVDPETRMLPNFLVIGATKSGTTALYDYLRQHPAIFMPALKEPRFFLYDGTEDSARFPVRSLEDYAALFAEAAGATARGEATPQYLTAWAAMTRIHETLPGARLIAALRDPAERAFSIYLMNLRNRGHNRAIPFAEALDGDINLRRGYAPYLGRWFELFGAEHLRIVLFEDIVRDAVATTQGLYGFLGVDPAHVPGFTGVVNPGGLPKRPLVHRVLSDKRLRETARRVLPAGLVERGREIRSENLEKRRMTPAERAAAVAIFREDILRTQDLIGRDLSAWLAS